MRGTKNERMDARESELMYVGERGRDRDNRRVREGQKDREWVREKVREWARERGGQRVKQ